MLLGAYARYAASEGRGLVRFTIDAQSMTGYNEGNRPALLAGAAH
jgi:hypothetical protein